MACRIHYQLYDADGMHRKAKKPEKKIMKVETISVGNTNLGGTKDYVGTIEELSLIHI